MKKLVIAEKASVGRSIADVLGAKEQKNGYISGDEYIISWCVGHLVELAAPDEYDERYSKWQYGNLPIIPDIWKYKAAHKKESQLKLLTELMNRDDVESIICATDAGREGELIFRLVYNYSGCRKPFERLWISSMEKSAIRRGFLNLKDSGEYDRLYNAALCRSQADWIVGINATRLFSILYNETLSVGRVLSPTLALLVKREKEVTEFKKRPFYTVDLDFGGLVMSSARFDERNEAEKIRAVCNGKPAIVKSVERQEKSKKPPKLHDLTTLQREANRIYGFTAQQTLDYAQSLYEKGLLTYPRTDSRYLTEDMAGGLPTIIDIAVLSLPLIGEKISDSKNIMLVIDNSKVTDHHAIIPTVLVKDTDISELPTGEKSILLMVAVRLICAVGEKHVYAETTVTAECEGFSFKISDTAIVNDGWKAVERLFKNTCGNEDDDTKDAPAALVKGDEIPVDSARVREGFTSPPQRYSEDTLLRAMETAGAEDMAIHGLKLEEAERKGLGTPATRAGIIERLVKSGFVERKQKQLIPVQKGINLITVLPNVIKSPSLTAEWEAKLKQVERGQLTADEFMDGINKLISELVRTNNSASIENKAIFLKTRGSEVIGTCPRCGGSVYDDKKGYFCDSHDCAFALWKESKFFTAKRKKLDKRTAAALLKEGRVFMTGLYSEKTGKTYDAEIILDDTGGKYVNFKMIFTNDN